MLTVAARLIDEIEQAALLLHNVLVQAVGGGDSVLERLSRSDVSMQGKAHRVLVLLERDEQIARLMLERRRQQQPKEPPSSSPGLPPKPSVEANKRLATLVKGHQKPPPQPVRKPSKALAPPARNAAMSQLALKLKQRREQPQKKKPPAPPRPSARPAAPKTVSQLPQDCLVAVLDFLPLGRETALLFSPDSGAVSKSWRSLYGVVLSKKLAAVVEKGGAPLTWLFHGRFKSLQRLRVSLSPSDAALFASLRSPHLKHLQVSRRGTLEDDRLQIPIAFPSLKTLDAATPGALRAPFFASNLKVQAVFVRRYAPPVDLLMRAGGLVPAHPLAVLLLGFNNPLRRQQVPEPLPAVRALGVFESGAHLPTRQAFPSLRVLACRWHATEEVLQGSAHLKLTHLLLVPPAGTDTLQPPPDLSVPAPLALEVVPEHDLLQRCCKLVGLK